ncbi:MAG: peptidoglycan-associated lipoprotein Pal [Deltaproteobacteria bacterium]|nr:peptidoglycan-associated lipoprotein Pal [Deltaproteobacteria bacterium]
MGKKFISGSIAIFFVCSVFLISSCAKKQVGVEGGVNPPAGKSEEMNVVKEKSKSVVVEGVEAEKAAARKAALARDFENLDIYFDYDRSNLKPEAQQVLREKADFLRANPSYSVLIAGNCDDRGTEEYNLALGERRAMSAKKFLVALGISPDRIKTISYGELRPADPANNPVAWALNRRDTFKLFQ